MLHSCRVANDLSISGGHAFVHLERSTVAGRLTVDLDSSTLSLVACRIQGTASVSAGEKGVTLLINDSRTEGACDINPSGNPCELRSDQWTCGGRLTARLNNKAEVILTNLRMDEPSVIHVEPAPNASGAALRLKGLIADELRIEGSAAGAQGSPQMPRVALEAPLSAKVLGVSHADLSQQEFRRLPLSVISLGPGNTFPSSKFKGRSVLADADKDGSTPRELAFMYASLRSGIEKGADTTLANDFYIGEMKARARYERVMHRCIIWLYGVLGGWGVRPWRPFAWTIGIVLVMLGVGLYGHGVTANPSNCTAPDRFVVAMAVISRIIPGLSKTSGDSFIVDSGFELVLVAMKICIAVLVGLGALGLRSKVRR